MCTCQLFSISHVNDTELDARLDAKGIGEGGSAEILAAAGEDDIVITNFLCLSDDDAGIVVVLESHRVVRSIKHTLAIHDTGRHRSTIIDKFIRAEGEIADIDGSGGQSDILGGHGEAALHGLAVDRIKRRALGQVAELREVCSAIAERQRDGGLLGAGLK